MIECLSGGVALSPFEAVAPSKPRLPFSSELPASKKPLPTPGAIISLAGNITRKEVRRVDKKETILVVAKDLCIAFGKKYAEKERNEKQFMEFVSLVKKAYDSILG
jgi:GMP synthase PP-ATPase subunit